MDQATLVDRHLDDGVRIIERLRAENIDVTAAFWLRASEDHQWYFYIASKTVDQQGLAKAYRAVLAAVRPLTDLWVDLFQIKLIGSTNPIAQDVLNLYQKYPAQIPTVFRGSQLGRVHVDEAYIYPPRRITP